jgi:ribonuclease T1
LDFSALAREAPRSVPDVAAAELPPEARDTLALIKRGGPFPYRRDGSVFGNFERRLPMKPRGYYREYTVRTPGERGRGARRIVAGSGADGDAATSGEYYYTGDHYGTFRRIRE